jgi:hypothetical protein
VWTLADGVAPGWRGRGGGGGKHGRRSRPTAPGEDGTGEFVGVGGSWTRGGDSRGIEELLDSSKSQGTGGRRENPVSVPVARYSLFSWKSSRETNRGSVPVPQCRWSKTFNYYVSDPLCAGCSTGVTSVEILLRITHVTTTSNVI